MKIKVYFLYNSTKVDYNDYDEDIDDYRPTTTHTKSIEVQEIESKNIERAFSLEDGDGDECGSYSNNIFLITDEKGSVLWDNDYKDIGFNPSDIKNKSQEQIQEMFNNRITNRNEIIEQRKKMLIEICKNK